MSSVGSAGGAAGWHCREGDFPVRGARDEDAGAGGSGGPLVGCKAASSVSLQGREEDGGAGQEGARWYSRISPGSSGSGPHGSCSLQERRPSSLEMKSVPSRCWAQNELGHISQKEAAS